MGKLKEIFEKNTGAGLYVYFFQFCSLLPLPYVLVGAGNMSIFTSKSVLSFLFDVGISALPRAEALSLSLLYRLTESEIAVFFLIIAVALVYGFLIKKLFESEKAGTTARIIFAVLIAADLIVRVVPFGFNSSFGVAAAVIGFIFRAACLALLVYDILKKSKKSSE